MDKKCSNTLDRRAVQPALSLHNLRSLALRRQQRRLAFPQILVRNTLHVLNLPPRIPDETHLVHERHVRPPSEVVVAVGAHSIQNATVHQPSNHDAQTALFGESYYTLLGRAIVALAPL